VLEEEGVFAEEQLEGGGGGVCCCGARWIRHGHACFLVSRSCVLS
jgi:hypothetical protein